MASASPRKKLQLNIIDNTSTGAHMAIGQWKDPRSMSRHKDRLDYYVWLAKTAEKGKITSIFFADIYGVHETYGASADATFKGGLWVAMPDPVTLIGAMAQATTSIAFAVTQSTSYLSPYAVARTMSSLDHITNGRVGINVVTSFGKAPAKCFGIEDAIPHDKRYAAAEEYMEILYSLWEQSWEDGAQVWSSEPEMAYDPSKIHKIDFNGKYHKFSGYHQTHPSPQRTPSIFQAGQSKTGVAFAGRHAEGIYCGTPTIAKLRSYADSVRQPAREAGRDPNSVKLFCSLCPILGCTEEEAQAKREKYRKNASVQGGLSSFCALTGVDLGKYDLDQPFNFDDEDLSKAGVQGIFNNFKTAQDDKPWTPRMVGERVAMGGFGPMPVGTPEQVADVVEKWFVEGDVDGFNIYYQSNPESIEDLVEMLVPELQKRGMYWDDYPAVGGTLRENMQHTPGQPLAAFDHPAAKLRWDAVKSARSTGETIAGAEEMPAISQYSVDDSTTPVQAVPAKSPEQVSGTEKRTSTLEICRRCLKDGIKPTDSAVISAFRHIRETTGAQCALYAAMEQPDEVFTLISWPSIEASHDFAASPLAASCFAPLNALSCEGWREHVSIDKMDDLPLTAPIMTISRCFFNEDRNHVEQYLQQTESLLPSIEAEIAPYSYVAYFTDDTTETCHKRMVFGGWRSKKQHQLFASKLRKECEFFEDIPLHYDPETQHRHCWNVEKETTPEMFEVLDGFVHQKPGKGPVVAKEVQT